MLGLGLSVVVCDIVGIGLDNLNVSNEKEDGSPISSDFLFCRLAF